MEGQSSGRRGATELGFGLDSTASRAAGLSCFGLLLDFVRLFRAFFSSFSIRICGREICEILCGFSSFYGGICTVPKKFGGTTPSPWFTSVQTLCLSISAAKPCLLEFTWTAETSFNDK